MSLLLCEVVDAQAKVDSNVATLEKDGVVTGAVVVGTGVELKIQNGRIVAELKSLQPTSQFLIGIWSGPKAEANKLVQFSKSKIKRPGIEILNFNGEIEVTAGLSPSVSISNEYCVLLFGFCWNFPSVTKAGITSDLE